MRIKTREALRSIKKVDRAEILVQKTKGGVSNLQNAAEQGQGDYESETEYASSFLQEKAERIGGTAICGADRAGRWGINESRGNLVRLKKRSKKKSVCKWKAIPQTTKKVYSESRKTAKTARFMKKAAVATAKFLKTAPKAIAAAIKAAIAGTKAIVAAIVAGGWIAVVIIVLLVVFMGVIGAVSGELI
ncbi:MAG: hypothetical protein IJW72_02560 [Alphaproteobacteria bacterium]|nr:hypothetical protein [Alphaproteobacteria bacterium]